MTPLQDVSLETAQRQLTREFRRVGLDAPALDARLIVGHALGLNRTALAAQSRRMLTADECGSIAVLAARRLEREPMARILGGREFWSLWFKINDETLLPRPESEAVVEAALAALELERRQSGTLRIADLGTGSGALLLALLSELPNADGIGTDINLATLDCARENAVAVGLAARCEFVLCSYASALQRPLDLLVSNPPYVRSADIHDLEPEVRGFDPRRALDGGSDGLDGYRAIATDAARLLAADGLLIVEIGCGQADPVAAIFAEAGLARVALRHDLLGIVRALVMRRA